jgi:nicotinamidase-related amidase
MRILKNKTAALLIDIQEKLFPHMADKEQFLARTKILIEGLKTLEIPIIITEQYRKGLGETIGELKQLLPDFSSFEKNSFSCCDDENIINNISTYGKPNVIVFGIESHVCVLQTVLDLKQKGYLPVVLEDCITSRNLHDKEIAVKRMIQEGAIVTTSESILFELTRLSGNDQFKAISKLVK